MRIRLNETDLSKLRDEEIRIALNTTVMSNGYSRLRTPTEIVWIAILRAFEEAGVPQTVRQVFYKN